MRTAQGGAAGANIQHPLTSAYGTLPTFSGCRIQVRLPAHCRRSGLTARRPCCPLPPDLLRVEPEAALHGAIQFAPDDAVTHLVYEKIEDIAPALLALLNPRRFHGEVVYVDDRSAPTAAAPHALGLGGVQDAAVARSLHLARLLQPAGHAFDV